jgi:hypothetical protein
MVMFLLSPRQDRAVELVHPTRTTTVYIHCGITEPGSFSIDTEDPDVRVAIQSCYPELEEYDTGYGSLCGTNQQTLGPRLGVFIELLLRMGYRVELQ